MLAVMFLAAVFLAMPARRAEPAALAVDYVQGLLRYEGVRYHWGGESPTGIDCSGLVRRGLVDAAFLRGLRTLDPGMVRLSLRLWWNDCTAKELGEGRGTTPISVTPSIETLDHGGLQPGDLAVSESGLHVMAYLGGRRWIEADPDEQKVITVTVPGTGNAWFLQPMKIVRWKALQPLPVP
jgi:hypothetical protein